MTRCLFACLGVVLAFCCMAEWQAVQGQSTGAIRFIRGDMNCDGVIDIGDPIFGLHSHFTHGPDPCCFEGADANDDGNFDISDNVYDLQYLFVMGPEPPSPFPDCGRDPGGMHNPLPCDTFPPCN